MASILANRPSRGLMDELDSLRSRILSEDSLASSTTELNNIEESKYASLQGVLEADAQDLEGESWSLVVDQDYLKPMSKEAIKRQDVIYELMQTEMHHVRTLKVLLKVYMGEVKECLQMDEARLKRLFPRLDGLLDVHLHFLSSLKLRRQQSLEEGSHSNYQIRQLADILITQFSGELGENMKDFYGSFCGLHGDAVSFYKELVQNNKKFQNHMRKVGQLSIVRRLGIQECFLLVAQRITKYPVLVERILHNTEAKTEEHSSLEQALALIRNSIFQVDTAVSKYEKLTRLRDIAQRLEPKSQGRLKEGHQFSREDLQDASRTLLHDAAVTLKTSSSRHKDIHAVLLTDVLLLLQEKDQKFVFSTVDNKPPVISLQRLIVREVAHDDKAMFLLCDSFNGKPEMYEIRTGSNAERNTWMALIRQAVESCPEGQVMVKGQEEEQEARAAKLMRFQEHLARRDKLIEQNLNEKLQIFAFFFEELTGVEVLAHNRPLWHCSSNARDLQQGETLLRGAINDVEILQNLLLGRMRETSQPADDSQGQDPLLRRAQTFGGFDTKPLISPMEGESDPATQPLLSSGVEGDESQARGEDEPLEIGHLPSSPDPEQQDPEPYPKSQELSFFDRVLMLSQRLYSLQAIIVQQDSRADLQQLQRPTVASAASPVSSVRRNSSDLLLEQEKQRNLEKQRVEQADFQREQAQHRQERQRWEKERERERVHGEQLAAQLAEREEACRQLEELLNAKQDELEVQRSDYQGDLVRLRDSTQKVQRDGMLLKQQLEKLKKQTDQQAQVSQSFRMDKRRVSPERHANPTATTNNHHHNRSSGGSDGEVPPAVPLRKESMSPLQPMKAEVPVQLVSTTNQTHKAASVQQQIPTKLATHSKAKEQGRSSKRPHRSSHQRAASIDMSLVVPIKMTGKEGGSLRAKKSASPQRIHSDHYTQRLASNVKPSQSFSAHSQSHNAPPPEPPPFPKDVLKKKEHVILL
ncbi:Rho guanine nucleotide exchange factor 18 [Merluccius polli]|uniref:Rho guanine nucleotide exchange factor 18 n=1 Tax=Merluccius polli TaxID=89951 RepID=A0AA47MDV6_MERPO|nr:Rho guanine nucleotide exchange factor 18 [Merluccius polli]